MTNDTDHDHRRDALEGAGAVTTLTRVESGPPRHPPTPPPAGAPRAMSFWLTAETRTLAELARVWEPLGNDSPGARWLRATAARAARVSSLAAAGKTRENVVRLHAHHAVEDLGHDTLRVASDLNVRVRRSRINQHETRFAAEVALFPVARLLLERLSEQPLGRRVPVTRPARRSRPTRGSDVT
jgi:hypothetical protein